MAWRSTTNEASTGRPLREFNVDDDHVHLLIDYLPKVAVTAVVNSLKAVSARRLRSEFTGRVNRHIMHGHFWSPPYFAWSPALLRRILRRCPTGHHPAVHRTAKARGLVGI